MTSSPIEKERNSRRFKRNLHAKRLRESREYSPRIIPGKKKDKSRTRINIRNLHTYISDDE